MKVIIDISDKNFSGDIANKFQPFFVRVKEEIQRRLNFGYELFCGTWELEEAEMLRKCFAASVILPDNATNGDVIKAMFPHFDVEIDEHKGYVRIFYFDFYTTYPLKWWNAPYKGGHEDGKA